MDNGSKTYFYWVYYFIIYFNHRDYCIYFDFIDPTQYILINLMLVGYFTGYFIYYFKTVLQLDRGTF